MKKAILGAVIILASFFIQETRYYSVLSAAYERGHCIKDSKHAPCPQEWIDYVNKDGEKGYWHTYCTALPEKCTKVDN